MLEYRQSDEAAADDGAETVEDGQKKISEQRSPLDSNPKNTWYFFLSFVTEGLCLQTECPLGQMAGVVVKKFIEVPQRQDKIVIAVI